jgi:hypothetical protein
MSLSLSTIALFAFLVPGFLFKFFIYQASIIKKPILGDNALHATVSILVYSSAAVAPALISLTLLAPGFHTWYSRPHADPIQISVFKLAEDQIKLGMDLSAFIHVIGLWMVACVVAIFLGNAVRHAASRSLTVRKMLFGPLASLYKSNRINLPTAYVLTKQQFDDRRLMYAGHAEEIGLGSGSNIEYIVIRTPHKFFLKLSGEKPMTTFDLASPMGNPKQTNILFLSKENIENIHFQDYPFLNNTSLQASNPENFSSRPVEEEIQLLPKRKRE